MLDIELFTKGVMVLENARLNFGKQLSDETKAIWYGTLKDLEDICFDKAIFWIIQFSEDFPNVAQIRKMAERANRYCDDEDYDWFLKGIEFGGE